MDQLPVHFFGFGVFLLGLIIGSFLNVVIYRVPLRQSVAFPGSHCPACDAPVKAYDNIPVFSYAVLRGRCRNCQVSISPVYPAVELLVGLLFLAAFYRNLAGSSPAADISDPQFWLGLLGDVVFISLLVPLIFIDMRHKLLPNVITYPGFIVMLVLRALAPDPIVTAATRATWGLTEWPAWAVALVGSALGAAVGGGSLWLVREVHYRIRHMEGMGQGDPKMMLMVGAYLGWQLTLLTIFIASLVGSVIGLLIIQFRGGTMKTEIPFGVFLGPAALISLFIGQPLIAWYLSFYQ